MNWIQKLRNFLPILGIIIFIYIFIDVGVDKIIDVLRKISLTFLLISAFLSFPRIILSTYKWHIIAEKQEIYTNFLNLIKLNFIGLFYGTITPLWLGDYIRIPYLKWESNKPLGRCASNVLIDQIIEFLALFLLAAAGSFILFSKYPHLLFILLFFLLLFLFIVLFFKEKRRSKKIFSMISSLLLPDRIKSLLTNEFEAFYSNIPSFSFLLLPLLIELISYTIFFSQIYLIAYSLNLSIPFFNFVLIYPIASLVGLIPITISGFGTREGTLIMLFKPYGIEENFAVALSLAGYFITMLIPAFVGAIVSFLYKPKAKLL